MARLENFRLKVFRAVAEHLNFRKAAEQLFLTQPAVTLQIKAPARERGVRTEPFMEDELILIMPRALTPTVSLPLSCSQQIC